MGKFDGILLATDMDGTLCNSQGKVSEENARAIAYFQQEGGFFTVASGRFANHFEQFAHQFVPNAPMVVLNGTLLYDAQKKEVIERITMHEDALKDGISILEEFPFIRMMWINGTWKSADYTRGKDDFDAFVSSVPHPWHKLMFSQSEEETPLLEKALWQKFGGKYRFDASWSSGLEMYNPNAGKDVLLKKLKKMLGVHTLVTVGDYGNDVAMIAAADIGYAVANAVPAAKAAATRVTVSCDEHAIAHIIEELAENI